MKKNIILLYDEKYKDKILYDSVIRYLNYVKNINKEEITEYDIHDFYHNTKHPFSYIINEDIYMIPMIIENNTISYSYSAVLDNINRNDFKRNNNKNVNVFYFGIYNKQIEIKSYYDAFIKRINIDEQNSNCILHKKSKIVASEEDGLFSWTHK